MLELLGRSKLLQLAAHHHRDTVRDAHRTATRCEMLIASAWSCVTKTMVRPKETGFRTEAMTSRIAQLAIVDALIACVALAGYDLAVSTIEKTFDVLSIKRM